MACVVLGESYLLILIVIRMKGWIALVYLVLCKLTYAANILNDNAVYLRTDIIFNYAPK